MIRKTRLYTPGPTPLLPAAQFAMAAADIHHRTPEFRALFLKVLAQLKVFMGTQNDVLLLSSSGTGAMEASVTNFTSPGDRVLVLTAGKFGERWVDLAKAYGLVVDVIQKPYGQTFDLGEGANLVLPPFRVGIYPMHDAATTIHIEAVGQLDTASQPVASRSATLSFIQGKKVVLQLPLLAVCKDVACKVAYSTCQADGKCGSDTVDSKNLPAYVANQPVPATDAATLIPDAQMPVLPMDAAVDKSVDSAVDASLKG